MKLDKELLERIQSNDPTLTELTLPEMDHDDFKNIAKPLEKNNILSKLTFEGRYNDDKGISTLLLSLLKNYTLIELNISLDDDSTDREGYPMVYYKDYVPWHHEYESKLDAILKRNKALSETKRKALQNDLQNALNLAKLNHPSSSDTIQHLLILTTASSSLAALFGYTALHVAAETGNTALIQPLLAAGVSLTEKDITGLTPLELAARWGNSAFVKRCQQELHLQQLLRESVLSRQAIQDFASRKQALQNDIKQLVHDRLSEYAHFLQKMYNVFYQLQTREAQLSLQDYIPKDTLKPLPQLLLKKYYYFWSVNKSAILDTERDRWNTFDKLKVLLKKGELWPSHPLFNKLYKQKKLLQSAHNGLRKKNNPTSLLHVLEAFATLHDQYIAMICQMDCKEQINLLNYCYDDYSEVNVVISGVNLSPCFLNREPGNILTPPWGEKRQNEHGTASVYSVGNIHFKFNPHAPGVEFMVSSLGDLLAGQGATPTELVKIIGRDGIPRCYQASKTVQGKELQYVLNEHPEFVAKIRSNNFSAMVVLGLLTDPADGKADNYMVEFEVDNQGQQWLQILGIDNDIAFADDAVIRHEDKGIIKHLVNIRNVLYFFPQMHDSLDPQFLEILQKREPEIILLQWLNLLYQKNQDYQMLLNEGVFSQEEFSGDNKVNLFGLRLPIKLSPHTKTNQGTIDRLYHKLIKLQDTLKSKSNLTHWQLFELLEPHIAKVYQHIYANVINENNPNKKPLTTEKEGEIILLCMKKLYEESIEDYKELKEFRRRLEQGDTSAMTLVSLKTAENHGFEKDRTASIEECCLEFLHTIDYSRFNKITAKAFFAILGSEEMALLWNKKPLLHVATETKNEPLLTFLLKYHLQEVDITNSQGITALHIAASIGEVRLIAILYQYKAKIDHKDTLGRTAMDKAKKRQAETQLTKFTEVIEWLKNPTPALEKLMLEKQKSLITTFYPSSSTSASNSKNDNNNTITNNSPRRSLASHRTPFSSLLKQAPVVVLSESISSTDSEVASSSELSSLKEPEVVSSTGLPSLTK